MYGVVILVVVLALCIGMTALVGWAERRKHAGPGKPINWRTWSKNMAILAAFGSVLALLGYFFLGLLSI